MKLKFFNMSEPKIAQKGPFVREEKPGTYYWCACGLSKGQPYCDGSHKVTDFKPVAVTIEEEKKVAWCGCKHTKNGCFCDGTHRTI